MKYKILWCEVKREGSTNGRAWKITEMSLEDEAGVKTDKVSTFNNVAPGQEIEGDIKTNDKGYLNFIPKLEPPAFIKNNNFKTQQMEKVMEKKEQSITKFQDSKEESIKVSSTMRDAVLLTIAEKGNTQMSANEMKSMIEKWRYWLYEKWEMTNEKVVNNTSPF